METLNPMETFLIMCACFVGLVMAYASIEERRQIKLQQRRRAGKPRACKP